MNARTITGNVATLAGRGAIFRSSTRDASLVVIAFVHALVLAVATTSRSTIALAASAVFIACAVWWSSNTVSHNHLHNPIFVSRRANQVFSILLGAVLGVPQTIWKQRHLWHHAGEPEGGARIRLGRQGILEVATVLTVWGALVAFAPTFALCAYLPGLTLGMILCSMQGHFEHTDADLHAGASYYGRLYNRLWLNDGYHAEHHLRPTAHWTTLPSLRASASAAPGYRESAFPPVLRFLETLQATANRCAGSMLGWLERLPLSSTFVRRVIVESHARAFARLLPTLHPERIQRVCIVGGGLFPRTVLVLQRLLPGRRLVVVDASAHNLAIAERELRRDDAMGDVELRHARFDPDTAHEFDLVVVPLAFVGDRRAAYRTRTTTLVHDWFWRRTAAGTPIAWWLLKRLNVAS
jgi:hypothetical protein